MSSENSSKDTQVQYSSDLIKFSDDCPSCKEHEIQFVQMIQDLGRMSQKVQEHQKSVEKLMAYRKSFLLMVLRNFRRILESLEEIIRDDRKDYHDGV